MSGRNVPWVFLGLAAVVAVFALFSQSYEPYVAEHGHDPFEHVADAVEHWDVLYPPIRIPVPIFREKADIPIRISKFAILELVAAGLICAIFIPLCRYVARGEYPRGAWQNAFESVLTFIRDEVAKPNIGDNADRYVPFLWTIFLFVLFCNLLGMLPWMGSPTANLYVTGALALCSFVAMHGCAAYKMGPIEYLKSMWPHVEIVENPWRTPGAPDSHDHGHGGHEQPAGKVHRELKPGNIALDHPAPEPAPQPTTLQIATWIGGLVFGLLLCTGIFVIDLVGTVIKGSVLAVRLFANMFAGHTVLAMILSFIIVAANAAPLLWGSITVSSVLAVAALSLLELFVAFLQAYIFVFLTSLFMGMALHPQH
jgi:F-type H+-transporting ATPase subunit a